MALALSYLLISFAAVTLIMAMGVVRKRSGGFQENYLFSFFCLGSMLWSFCFGLLLVQTDVNIAYYLRCVGMIGTFAYLVFATLLMVQWSGIEKRYIRHIKYFPMSAIVLYSFLLQRKNTTYRMSNYGMTYIFKTGIWNNLYILYCVVVAFGIFLLIFHMLRRGNRKSIQVLGRKLLICEGVIILGMVFDTILPMFGIEAFPGSTITQFFGAILLYQAFDFYKSNVITVRNMSEFVYYSVETPVLIYDDKIKLRIVNKNAVEFLGIPKKYENTSLSDLFNLDSHVLQSEGDTVTLDAYCTKNQAYCRLVINKIFDQYKDVFGFIIIVDDLTDKIQIIHELEEAKQYAELANRAKSSFLAKMSHEIRTPLNTVLGMDEMILRESSSEQVLKYAGYIKNAGQTLLNIINDLLDLSKLESGKIHLVEADYCLADLLQDTLNIVTLKLREKGLELVLDIAQDAPAYLHGDNLRIKQIITNVMNNAVKYTDKGTITLRLHWAEAGEDEVLLSVQVADTGRGIRKEDMDKLFAPYERLEEEKNYAVEGTGLGLAIAKDLLDLMGGGMEVESEFGKGSVFKLHFVQKVVSRKTLGMLQKKREEAPVGLEDKKSKKLSAPNARILAVDDTVANLMVIQGLLQRTKIKVDMAKSGKDALRMAAKKQYQMIFLDHMMPEMDGEETLHAIQSQEGGLNTQVPVIALTANAIVGAKEKYLQMGFTDYLSKPLEATELEKMLMKYLPPDLYLLED